VRTHEDLFVFWDGYPEPAGYLAYGRKGRVQFRYAEEWLQKYGKSISLRLPSSQAEFTPRESTDFFENLLPEDRIYESLCQKYHIDEDNIYKFLSIFGGECAGALSVVKNTKHDYLEPLYKDVTEALITHLENPSSQISLIEGLEARLSLAGAQNKLPVHMEKGRFFVPNDGSPAPTTAILKSISPWFGNLHKNEHFCMSLARAVGLKAPRTEILHLGRQEAYLIERYDRIALDGRIIRLHQEDFCQAMGYRRLNKYQSDKGPDFAKCNQLLMQPIFGDSLPARREFIRCAIFNYLIGNCDAHA
jgi:serine/threonine-protein kinase HipA